MKRTISIQTASLGALMGIAAMLCIAASPAPEIPTQKWEYRVVEGGDSEKAINQLGREGWELVSESSCYRPPLETLKNIGGTGTIIRTFVLKRQLAN
jgi:hypothetical protein